MNDLKVSSKTGPAPLKNLDPDSGPVPWKNQTQKSLYLQNM